MNNVLTQSKSGYCLYYPRDKEVLTGFQAVKTYSGGCEEYSRSAYLSTDFKSAMMFDTERNALFLLNTLKHQWKIEPLWRFRANIEMCMATPDDLEIRKLKSEFRVEIEEK